MTRALLLTAAALGLTGGGLGAFGAHGVEGLAAATYPDPAERARRLANWHTAADYHLWHALAAGLCGLLAGSTPSRSLAAAGACFAAGVLVFSGSLYLLVLTGERRLGAVTPLGGVLLLAGWALLGAAAWRVRPAGPAGPAGRR